MIGVWLKVAPQITFPGYSGVGRNAFIEKLSNLSEPNYAKSEVSNQVPINPYASCRPANPAFFAYTGSLTTPPCTDGLQGLFMESPIDIALVDLEFIRNQTTFVKNSSAVYITRTIDGSNSRPTQPLNGRVVKRSTGVLDPSSSDPSSDAKALQAVILGAIALAIAVLLLIGVIYLLKRSKQNPTIPYVNLISLEERFGVEC